MELLKRRCKPCEGNVLPFTKLQAQEYLKQVPDWKLKDDKIIREFKFKDFKQAMSSVNKIARIAEKEQHHPDLYISYSKIRVILTTHKIKGLSENDFILAAKISNI